MVEGRRRAQVVFPVKPVGEGHLHRRVLRQNQRNRIGKFVRIADLQDPARAVDRKGVLRLADAVAVHVNGANRPVFQPQARAHGVHPRNLPGLLPLVQESHLRPVHRCGVPEGGNVRHRPQQRHQRAHVVNPHVEGQRPALPLQEGENLGVQRLVPVHRHLHRGHLADHPRVDQIPGRLDSRAQHRVRRHAQVEPLFIRQRHQLPGFFQVRGEYFLGVNVLPRQQHFFDDVVVGKGRRQVHDQLDLRVGGRLVDGHRPCDAEFLRPGLGGLPRPVAHGAKVDHGKHLRKVPDINAADHPAADDGRFDFRWLHLFSPSRRRFPGCPFICCFALKTILTENVPSGNPYPAFNQQPFML